ncbi:hypothetical protein DFH07DRAFT_795311 [Mycena maculata]|uniref:F-box domain-containing protein n=1 Tax=Mycena maculata TaxID=230809 RepID=A0AAD7K5J9_9AGAR|nr:hypothetical protein DFH07DRAFT_795311 [Mycena maculata]
MISYRNHGHQAWELGGHSLPSTPEQRAALVDIKSQLIRYKDSIEVLEKQQHELEASLSLVIYPVLTLPIEITSRIFILCLPAHGRVRPSPSTAPLLLAQICRSWRDVALSTCELWSSFYFDGPVAFDLTGFGLTANPIVPRDNGARALLQTWLSRAKGYPISLGLNTTFRTVPPAFASLVSSVSEQIQRLDLHILPQQFNRFRLFHTPFPRLQHLATTHSTDKDLRELLKEAPALRELRLLGKEFTLNFSLPALTRLEIREEISKEIFLDLLAKFPVLEHLHFSLEEFGAETISEASIPTLFPHLTSLTLASSSSCFALRLVTLPNLLKLEIPPFAEPTVVLPFLSRSSCTIQHLVLSLGTCFMEEDDDEPLEEALTWLNTFPFVVTLEITSWPALDSLAMYLDSKSLPRLRYLTVSSSIGRNTPDVDYDTLIEMLRHRRNPAQAVKLQKFHLKLDLLGRPPDDHAYEWCPGYLASAALEDLIADGLDFRVSFSSASENGSYTWPAPTDTDPPVPFFP